MLLWHWLACPTFGLFVWPKTMCCSSMLETSAEACVMWMFVNALLLICCPHVLDIAACTKHAKNNTNRAFLAAPSPQMMQMVFKKCFEKNLFKQPLDLKCVLQKEESLKPDSILAKKGVGGLVLNCAEKQMPVFCMQKVLSTATAAVYISANLVCFWVD